MLRMEWDENPCGLVALEWIGAREIHLLVETRIISAKRSRVDSTKLLVFLDDVDAAITRGIRMI
jgi:hypothetical protein